MPTIDEMFGPPPEPKPLLRNDKPFDFPIDALPSPIRDAVEEAQASTQAPVAMIASSALSAVSAAAQAFVSVERDPTLRGPASLYFLTVASSGERKSTCDRKFTRAIAEWEAEMVTTLKPQLTTYRVQLKAWEAEEAGLRDGIKKAARDGNVSTPLVSALVDLERRRPVEPIVPSMLRKDDTPEAFAVALARYPVAAILSAEAGTIFGSHSMNPDSVMRNLAQLNECWDGGHIKRDRVSTQSVDVQGMRVTAGLLVQPDVLHSFVSKTGSLARGIGFLARFLFSEPESTQGTRFYKEPAPNEPDISAFNAHIRQLMSVRPLFDAERRLVTRYLPLAPDARDAWVMFHDEIEEELRPGGDYHDVKDVASKTAENAARIAACFEFFMRGGNAVSVSADHMRGGISLARWYLSEAVRYCKGNVVPTSLRNAELLEDWLVEQFRTKKLTSVSPRTISQLGPAPLRDKAARDAAIDLLVDHNRLFSGYQGQKRELVVAAGVLKERGVGRRV